LNDEIPLFTSATIGTYGLHGRNFKIRIFGSILKFSAEAGTYHRKSMPGISKFGQLKIFKKKKFLDCLSQHPN